MDGALTTQPRTPTVPPARSASASSMQSPPASAEATSVSILSPVFARPGLRRGQGDGRRVPAAGLGWPAGAGRHWPPGDGRQRGCGYGRVCSVAAYWVLLVSGLVSGRGAPVGGEAPRRRKGVGEGATGEMAWGLGVDGRPAEGLQSPHRAPKALCGSCDARDGERIRSRGLSRPGWREIAGTLGQLQAGRQAGNGMACSRAKARLNWVSQGQRRGRCKVRRRAERVIRPTRAKTRRLRVLVVTIC